MKRCLLLVFAVLVSVVFVSSVYAQSPAVIPDKTEAADSKAAPGKKRLLRARGEVVSVDYASKTMVVKGTREVLAEMSFDVSNARSGRRHKIEDVKPGDRVAVSFTEADGKMVAKYVGKPRRHPGKKHYRRPPVERAGVQPSGTAPAASAK